MFCIEHKQSNKTQTWHKTFAAAVVQRNTHILSVEINRCNDKVNKLKDIWLQNKLRPLFINNNNNNNNTGRGKRVALQNNWSPAVGSSVCIERKAVQCTLPPQPSPRGRKSTFSLDPWREMNTKLHRENTNAEVGCYSAKPPSPLSHSTDTVASPSAIARTDRRMPLPDSAAHTRGVPGLRTASVF